jgi:hypothetical protein
MTVRYLDQRPDLSGHWKLDAAASRNVFPTTYELEIDQRKNVISMTTIAREARYVHHRELRSSKTLVIGGMAVRSAEEVTRRMGYSSGWSDSIECSATWKEDGTTLVVQTLTTLETSQGTHRVTTTSEYTLSTDLMSLTVREWRSTRTLADPVTIYVYRRVL